MDCRSCSASNNRGRAEIQHADRQQTDFCTGEPLASPSSSYKYLGYKLESECSAVSLKGSVGFLLRAFVPAVAQAH